MKKVAAADIPGIEVSGKEGVDLNSPCSKMCIFFNIKLLSSSVFHFELLCSLAKFCLASAGIFP